MKAGLYDHLTGYELALRRQQAVRERDYATRNEIDAELERRRQARPAPPERLRLRLPLGGEGGAR